MEKIKDMLFSEKGMRVVNGLFFLSMLFARSGIIFVAYLVWIIYLSFCIRNSTSKGSKVIYGVFIGLAAVMIIVNLYFLIIG